MKNKMKKILVFMGSCSYCYRRICLTVHSHLLKMSFFNIGEY